VKLKQQLFDTNAVKESELFEMTTKNLRRNPELMKDFMFAKLVNRLDAFYILAEKYRNCGTTEQQTVNLKSTG